MILNKFIKSKCSKSVNKWNDKNKHQNILEYIYIMLIDIIIKTLKNFEF